MFIRTNSDLFSRAAITKQVLITGLNPAIRDCTLSCRTTRSASHFPLRAPVCSGRDLSAIPAIYVRVCVCMCIILCIKMVTPPDCINNSGRLSKRINPARTVASGWLASRRAQQQQVQWKGLECNTKRNNVLRPRGRSLPSIIVVRRLRTFRFTDIFNR